MHGPVSFSWHSKAGTQGIEPVSSKPQTKAPLIGTLFFKCWEQSEREFQYLAAEYLAKLRAVLTARDIPNIRRIAVQKSWWDTIDSLDKIAGDIVLRYPEVNETLLKWSSGDNIWLRRIAIDHQMSRKDKTDTVLFKQIIVNNLGQTEFFY